jgi:hypothetical protein
MDHTFYINTATALTTVALYAGNEVIAEKRWKSELNEAEKLQPAVDELLRSQQLSLDDIRQLVVCVGPGGFTSVRVGVSAINAWSFAKHIPVAQVSVFDLYDLPDTILILSMNSNEAWVSYPGKEPQFLNREHFQQSKPFRFGGLLQPEWKEYLEGAGGTYDDTLEGLPVLEGRQFNHEIVKPWYYKDANITWSNKIRKEN